MFAFFESRIRPTAQPGSAPPAGLLAQGDFSYGSGEAAAIRQVFGQMPPPVSSTKSMHGHLMGGAGAVELLAVILALRDGVLAPTINHDGGDADCDLDVVPNMARRAEVAAALSNAFAFGGMNAVLALKRA